MEREEARRSTSTRGEGEGGETGEHAQRGRERGGPQPVDPHVPLASTPRVFVRHTVSSPHPDNSDVVDVCPAGQLPVAARIDSSGCTYHGVAAMPRYVAVESTREKVMDASLGKVRLVPQGGGHVKIDKFHVASPPPMSTSH
ncbi:hypothetical protein OsJ_07221 [Oryza sativa Japonica Group]|uniref:Uncharacterized protein n=1 Tax=Oryza sativa subsp. japonica TaxID=39947 RepID=B9F0P1_ORYSJ|nr:hypothetical protein OsJ_07221 [Oryza sativa Japonica Group]